VPDGTKDAGTQRSAAGRGAAALKHQQG